MPSFDSTVVSDEAYQPSSIPMFSEHGSDMLYADPVELDSMPIEQNFNGSTSSCGQWPLQSEGFVFGLDINPSTPLYWSSSNKELFLLTLQVTSASKILSHSKIRTTLRSLNRHQHHIPTKTQPNLASQTTPPHPHIKTPMPMRPHTQRQRSKQAFEPPPAPEDRMSVPSSSDPRRLRE